MSDAAAGAAERVGGTDDEGQAHAGNDCVRLIHRGDNLALRDGLADAVDPVPIKAMRVSPRATK